MTFITSRYFTFLMMILALCGCKFQAQNSHLNSEPQDVGPIINWAEPSRKNSVKTSFYNSNKSTSDIDFANNECSADYDRLSDSHKEICQRLIAKYCKNINAKSYDIEPVPLWRPHQVPAGYLRHLKAKKADNELINHFTCALYSHILEANNEILEERGLLLKIYQKSQKSELNHGEQNFIAQLALNYDVDSRDDKMWDKLLSKVDVVPVSLILAVGAVESGRGTSRFALEANNIFGRHAVSGCKKCVKAQGSNTYLIKYDTLSEAIDDQLRYLNRHWNYPELRDLRLDMRQDGLNLVGALLSPGLENYSERKMEYVLSLNRMMTMETAWYKYDALAL